MAVVVQSAFRGEVLALEAQRIGNGIDVQLRDLAVGAVVRGPDDFAIGCCEFLWGAEVVELVVEGFYVFRAVAFQQC
jgi:hypothetical protein